MEITDDVLTPVKGWKHGQNCSASPESYQTGRVKVYSTFANGNHQFIGDITTRTLPMVNSIYTSLIPLLYTSLQIQSTNKSVVELDTLLGTIKPTGYTGLSTIFLNQYGSSIEWDSKNVSVLSETPLGHLRFDPIVASVRLFVTNNVQSRVEPSNVTLELLPALFYLQQETEVTVSVVLADGRRLLITDPNEIHLVSSNASVANVSSNKIIGQNEGRIDLNVSWVVCSETLMWKVIEVYVIVDRYRPVFVPNHANTSVPEDSPIGFTITTVEAMDEDAKNDIQYNIKDDPYNGLFVIDPITGVITLNGPLDREFRGVYTLLIEATDSIQRQRLECFQQSTLKKRETPLSGSGDIDASASGSDADTSGSGVPVTPPTTPPTTPPPDNVTCIPVNPSVFNVSYQEMNNLILLLF